jgi:hypothetical protein
MSKVTFKTSYSVLNAWSMKRFEQAIGMYLGKPLPPSPQMQLGSAKHLQWEKYTRTHESLHPELGSAKVTDPQSEVKYEKIIPLSGDIQILLRGVPDCTDGHIVHEFKCGLGLPGSYVDTMQLPYYKLLLPELTEGYYRCFDPYRKKTTVGLQFLTDTDAENALEHIITHGSEMILYLQSQRLLKDYKL